MVKKCIYCGVEISEECVVDFCSRCGKGVWGEKMFNTIIKNMEDARSKGDLCSTNMLEKASNQPPSESEKEGFTNY